MKQRFSTLYFAALGLAAAIPLFFHTYLGVYSRLIADDFCTAWMANSLGVLRATWYWYRTWTGRYAATTLDSIMGVLGPGVTPFVTGLFLLAWCALLTWAIWSLLQATPNRLLKAIALAAGIVTITLLLAPNVPQSLYWGQGMRSVIPPMVLSAAYIGLFCYYARRNWSRLGQVLWCVVALVATFVSGGFSETFTAAQALMLTVATLWAVFFHRRYAMLTGAALLGALLAFIVVVIAPGNAIRQATYPPAPGWLEILRISFDGYGIFWSELLGGLPNLLGLAGFILMTFLLGIQLGPSSRKPWTIALTLCIGLLLTFACFPPAAYGTSDYPPERTQILPVYFLVLTIAIAGVFAGQAFSAHPWSTRAFPWLAAATLGLVLCASLMSANQLYAARDEYIAYAQEWDQANGLIRAARLRGDQQVVITNSPNWTHLNVLGNNPKFWVNVCYNGYYGIQVFGDVPADQ